MNVSSQELGGMDLTGAAAPGVDARAQGTKEVPSLLAAVTTLTLFAGLLVAMVGAMQMAYPLRAGDVVEGATILGAGVLMCVAAFLLRRGTRAGYYAMLALAGLATHGLHNVPLLRGIGLGLLVTLALPGSRRHCGLA